MSAQSLLGLFHAVGYGFDAGAECFFRVLQSPVDGFDLRNEGFFRLVDFVVEGFETDAMGSDLGGEEVLHGCANRLEQVFRHGAVPRFQCSPGAVEC